ncbi:MAG: glycosyl hydrolase family 18 protein [Alistipes sp.]
MKKNLISLAALLVSACTLFSCQESNEPMDGANEAAITRAYGDKTPKLVAYVEINDTNPLNAADYYLGATSQNKALIDIVELFAANIRKRSVSGVYEPTLFLNDKLTRVLEPDPANPTTTGYHQYVVGLQNRGIKVLLTILGDHQGIGLANMNATQTTQFAEILAGTVAKYGLDGIGFDDEYADYPASAPINYTSYSEIITKLRAKMPAGKLITVFNWGNTDTISAAAQACIDFSYPGNFRYDTFVSTPGMSLTNAHWSPMALNLGEYYSSTYLRTIKSNAAKTASGGYGAIMTFNLRQRSNRDPLPVLNAIAAGAYASTATRVANSGVGSGDLAQDWTFIPAGYEITMDNK